MLKLLIYEFIYSKKRFLYLLAYLLVLGVIVLLTYENSSYSEQILYQNELTSYIEAVGLKFLNMSFVFLGALFLIDHNQRSEIIYISYLSRTKVFIAKLSFYSILFFVLVISVYLFWFLYLTNFTHFYYYKNTLDPIFITYFLDLLIQMIISFFIVSYNKQNKMIFIILLMIVYNIILEDNFNKYLFYILPLNYYNEISNILIYKTIYLLLIIFCYYLYFNKKNIY